MWPSGPDRSTRPNPHETRRSEDCGSGAEVPGQPESEPFPENLDESTLYVQLNQMADDPDKTLEQFARELTSRVQAGKVRDVIVDVRLNNGGNYEATLPVIDALGASRRWFRTRDSS